MILSSDPIIAPMPKTCKITKVTLLKFIIGIVRNNRSAGAERDQFLYRNIAVMIQVSRPATAAESWRHFLGVKRPHVGRSLRVWGHRPPEQGKAHTARGSPHHGGCQWPQQCCRHVRNVKNAVT